MRAAMAEALALRGVRDLPHNLEAEQAVLGAILLDDTALDQVAPLVLAEDFYSLAHQHVYTVFAELAKETRKIDAVMVQQRLDSKGLLGGHVPRDLPFALASAVGTAANVKHYAEVVSELSRLRRMMLTAQRVVERGYEAGSRVRDFLEEAQQDVFSAAQGSSLETMKPFSEAMAVALDRLELIHKRAQEGLSHITGIPTGLPWLDDQTLGLQPGTLCIVAARPSVGKTALALNVAGHAATHAAKKVVFFSLEMPSDQLALRMLASEAKLDSERIGKGKLARHDWDRIMVQGDKLMGAPIWFDDSFALSPVELRSKCRKLKREAGLDLVVIDYLQLMHAQSERASQSREQEIATISRSLKALAKELGVPVLALSQLNRAVEKRKGERPMLADLRESGAIEQDADIVMFLHRPDQGDGDAGPQINAEVQDVELILAKHRQGPTGLVPLVFFKKHTFFAERKRDA
ncbi:MAG TPA: replicative DNA helicase [Anaeromyxobacteraceae bacterium]|nr:replicative DNA helicase [Anaeromyxobacteraceae bacterium]